MANEITVNYGLNLKKGSIKDQLPQNQLLVTFSGTHIITGIMDVGTVVSGLNVPAGITWTPHYGSLSNVSSGGMGSIDVGLLSSGTSGSLLAPIRLQPADVMPMCFKTTALYVQCTSGVSQLQYRIYEQ